MINPTRLRLYQLDKTQRDLLKAIRARGVRCSPSELSDTLTGSLVSPKATMLRNVADEIVTEAQSQADNAKVQAQEYLDGIVQSIEAERSTPTPKRKRQAEEEIALLRTENVALRQSKAISDRDRSDLFEQLQKAERRAKGKEQAFGMVSDMLATYPDEFDALLNKSRAKNSVPSFQSNGNDRGGK